MNAVIELYNGACDMFIRPQRMKYDPALLGPTSFKIGDKEFCRQDIKLENKKGLKLECSHYYEKQRLDKALLIEIDNLGVKELKYLLRDRPDALKDCVEKLDLLNKVKEVYKITEDHPRDKYKMEEIKTPCIVYLHGNCGCRLDSTDLVDFAMMYGFSLFAVDLSGSGLSEGEFISLGYYEKDDVSVVVEYLKNCKIVSQIGLWGRSMGAATSLIYTAEHPGDISCLVLDSPFSSLYQLASEVVHGMDLGIPSWILSSGFSLGMRFIRKSIRQKANFDIYEVAPLEIVNKCTIPAIFIHGENDNFVKPKHSLSLFENYPDKRKEIMLVAGDHNSMRPSDTLNYISMFLHRYLLSEHSRQQIREPIKPFGRTANTTIVKCFLCKQIRGLDQFSSWPYTVIVGIGKGYINLISPYTEKLIHHYPFKMISEVCAKEEDCLFLMKVPGHVDTDTFHDDHHSGIFAFQCAEAGQLFAYLQAVSNE